jgi:hypothetical protein
MEVKFGLFSGQIHAVKDNFATVGFFQHIQATEESGLAGAGRPDDTDHVPFVDGYANILQNRKFLKVFT